MTITPKKSKADYAFFGTPELAASILDALAAADHVPQVIVTTPDKPQGRGLKTEPTPVKAWALEHGVPVLQPEKLDDAIREELASYVIDLCVVVAYGKIIPQSILDVPRLGMFNVHYSLLPRWRGATPVESAILSGDAETGVSIQKMVFELDAGPVVAERRTKIDPNETAPDLRLRLNEIAKELLPATIDEIVEERATYREQDKSNITKCGKIQKNDGLILLSDDGIVNYRKFRAYYGWPGIFAYFDRNGKQIRGIITRARMERDAFVIENIKPEGKKEMPYADFLRSGATPAA